jgi:quercetin dioxygenase-like cupin family protein
VDRIEFEADLRREGYRVVNSSLKPNLMAPNHCHDFDAKAFVLGGEITITRDNSPTIFRAGDCFEVPTGCMHAEQVGPEGVALLSGRRRNGGPLTREAFESDLRREGFEVVNGGQQPDFAEELHAHDFDARIMVLSREITLTRDNKAETFRAGDHCELAAGCQHTAKVGRKASPTSSAKHIAERPLIERRFCRCPAQWRAFPAASEWRAFPAVSGGCDGGSQSAGGLRIPSFGGRGYGSLRPF